MLDETTFTEIVRARLTMLAPGADLPPEMSLAAMGLGSMDSVQLLLDLEEAFGIDLPDSLVTRETFESSATLRRAFDSVVNA